MLNLVILATTLWVCPGDVYSNEPRQGCKPFHESNKEGFSTVPETKQDPAKQQPSLAPSPMLPPVGTPGTPTVIIEQQLGGHSASPEVCKEYEEWLRLNRKFNDADLRTDMSTDENNRFLALRQQFGITSPPLCAPAPSR